MGIIETTSLTKRYGDVTAIEDLHLTVRKGEAFGFLGPNGAGKSTTINILLGFLEPSSGSACVLGHDVQTESKALRRRIGVVPEGTSVYEQLTGRKHVELATRMKNCDDDPEDRLRYVGLDPEDWDRRAGDYSKGMRQRLSLAMGLVGNPDLLILDEPTSGLDPNGMQDVRDIIREQTDAGRTVFMSSHLLAEVESVCKRVGIMNDGELVTVDEVDRLRETAVGDADVKLSVEAVPDELDLTAIEGVTDVTIADSTIRVACSKRDTKMAVIRHVDQIATVTDVVAEDISLEAVFETYTEDRRIVEESA
ncbi:ABC transporter ATP-binding protein [Halorussus sp. MSC15.2]|nr:ABC transporter ATP-binding protein [Halorussus sp. MSC15.2]